MKKALILTALALTGLLSCARKEQPLSPQEGGLRIVVGSLPVQTKSDPSSLDLVILVAASDGSIAATYPGTNATLQEGSTSSEMAVNFSGLADDTYTVYGFLNTQAFWAMESGGSTVSALTDLTEASAVEALQFTALEAGTTPGCESDECVPASAQGTATVTSQNGEVTLELVRCVAKVTMEFLNQSDAALALDAFSFTLGDLCPDRGYVLPYTLPDVPSGISYGDVQRSPGDGIELADGASVSYSFYVFPGVAPDGEYLLDLTFTESGSVHTFSRLPVLDDHSVDIGLLERNQHLHILTRIGRGTSVSFNFSVEDWTSLEESVHFD